MSSVDVCSPNNKDVVVILTKDQAHQLKDILGSLGGYGTADDCYLTFHPYDQEELRKKYTTTELRDNVVNPLYNSLANYFSEL